MAPAVRVLCDLAKQSQENAGVAWLIGVPWMPWTIVSSIRCLRYKDGDPDYAAEEGELRILLPGGLEVIGALLVGSDAAKACAVATKIREALNLVSSNDIVAATRSISSDGITFFSQALQPIEQSSFSSKEFWESTALLHCQVELGLSIYTSSGTSSDLKKQLDGKIRDLAESFTSSTTVCIMEGSSRRFLVRSQANEELQSVFPDSALFDSSIPHPLAVKLLTQQSKQTDQVIAPVGHYTPSAEGTLLHTATVSLDVLCLVSRNSALHKAMNTITRALTIQLESIGKALSARNTSLQLRPYHFKVPASVHPVTAIFDKNQLERDSVDLRKALHSRLGLPLDRPLFRVANALTIRGPQFISNRIDGKRLLDVHLGLPRCGISGGEVSVIDGSYEYYHYLQDRMDDKGWGCAYRSLQTIMSWFRLQHYTSMKEPSHREIQATLVEIGDKEPSFVGSQEWIGAIELSFVLDKLLGVTSKILSVRSGADLPEKCRELAAHFDTQGTPVMIGGGVLAYTLLGVDYNELTGESAFLILDPHYTGGEDLKTIRNGGWCGWKKAVSDTGREFFLRNKFYNLLLPQRPQAV
ncbi:hypothetical protein SELMODRAFT_444316 [Selaginella moellendorffii]|uniref:Probable Ufm1-specific protease n=1 Tax=Selaginella moellendorffii TaxID=88036 RepID=D8S8X8_SELML|nr:probable Ufm1-specific protease isoform X1 [Selaginella moellendorffii]XP_024540425.1 probable Ufm1-specific protease isoform X1 [Selaginella moellendorffii]XP_024540426.1 probable Ufm1-specific protease isoform X1 [Selaginella moellendorffii]EFJ19109.1 hypothetical protein SELMODRAFT_444316 [Selaginella moellendorffii]|eukprot:XP_002979707.1 probable Ufm1-specific protease isoform X1 [Selaginella moellendorffii]